jgi:hypothetical protein
MSIHKKQLPIAIAAVLSSSPLVASLAYQQQGIEERMTAIEKELAEKRRVSPTVKQENDFFVTGDFLYWHANESGTAYAVQVNNSGTQTGKVKNLKFEWDAGFRIGLGYRIPHDKWELAATWTCFTADANGRTSPGLDILYPEWETEIIADPASGSATSPTEMKGSWNMHLNILDGDISRYFMVTKRLALKPRFGIRGVWIAQDYKTSLEGGFNGSSSAAPPNIVQARLKIKNDFTGVGLRAGLDTEWDFNNRWSIYGNGAYSLIYGNFQLRQHDEVQLTTTPAGCCGTNLPTVKNITDSFHEVTGIAELALGLRWDMTFANKSMALRLQAGWEFNAYFGQNKFEHFGPGFTPGVTIATLAFVGNNETLSVQGFVFSGRLDF